MIVFFVYGLAFLFLGTAILLKHEKRSTLSLRSLLILLAIFGLLHGANEWSDMFLSLGDPYWTPPLFRIIKISGFYLGLSSFVFLLVFGARSVSLGDVRLRFLSRTLLAAALLFVVVVSVCGIQTGMSDGWYVTSGILSRYLLAFPGSLLAAAGLFRQSQSQIKEINSSAVLRNIRGNGARFCSICSACGRHSSQSVLSTGVIHQLQLVPKYVRLSCPGLSRRLRPLGRMVRHRNLECVFRRKLWGAGEAGSGTDLGCGPRQRCFVD
jgi:hypothetical protein